MIRRIFIIAMFALSFSVADAQSSYPPFQYQPQWDLVLKGGNSRYLSRLSAVVPLHETIEGLFFLNGFGLWDNKRAKEGNLGLGYRHVWGETILGINSFLDRRKSSHDVYHSQLTLGAEWLSSKLEVRANGYVPLTGRKNIGAVRFQRSNLRAFDHIEKPLYGFDVEGGGVLPSYPQFAAYASYYHFNGSNVKALHGLRLRSHLQLLPYVSLLGEYSYDQQRKSVYFIGLNFNLSREKRSLSLGQKMTQKVIRDIDVVTASYVDKQGYSEQKEPLIYTEDIQSLGPTREDFQAIAFGRINEAWLVKAGDGSWIRVESHDVSGVPKGLQPHQWESFIAHHRWEIKPLFVPETNTLAGYKLHALGRLRGGMPPRASSGVKTYADGHNHLHGILPASAIKIMLAAAREEWDKYWVDKNSTFIPEELVPTASILSMVNANAQVNTRGWLDSLDVLARIIVFSTLDLQDLDHPTHSYKSHDYQNTVRKMLFMDTQAKGHYAEDGRGMHSAGLLLSGCIGLRCLLALDSPTEHGSLISGLTQHFPASSESVKFSELFQAACLLDVKKPLTADNWLFSKLKDMNRRLQAHAEHLAHSSVVAALASSLWIPFDDAYGIRGLLRRGDKNDINWHMLTLRWLLEHEAKENHYFSEISMTHGDLPKTFNFIQNNAERFGFMPVTTGGVVDEASNDPYLPLVLQLRSGVGQSNIKSHAHKLYIRFLTGFVNALVLREENRTKRRGAMNRGLEGIECDQTYGCWAGIDMFGTENFVYDEERFHDWLTRVYRELKEINEGSKGRRRLWLRPHVGEGSWAEDDNVRINQFNDQVKDLLANFEVLNQLVRHYSLSVLKPNQADEVLEFIYRSLFTGWFPIDDLRKSNDRKAFTIPEFDVLPVPSSSTKASDSEKIGAANLHRMIAWVNDLKEAMIKEVNPLYPAIRFGHATHLGNNDVWDAIGNLNENKGSTIWLDLNLGSNIVTAAKSINEATSGNSSDKRTSHSASLKQAMNQIFELPFASGDAQIQLIPRSESIVKFIEALQRNKIKFILGTDGQGVESTKIHDELSQFAELIGGYFSHDSDKARQINTFLKENIAAYLQYTTDSLPDEQLWESPAAMVEDKLPPKAEQSPTPSAASFIWAKRGGIIVDQGSRIKMDIEPTTAGESNVPATMPEIPGFARDYQSIAIAEQDAIVVSKSNNVNIKRRKK